MLSDAGTEGAETFAEAEGTEVEGADSFGTDCDVMLGLERGPMDWKNCKSLGGIEVDATVDVGCLEDKLVWRSEWKVGTSDCFEVDVGRVPQDFKAAARLAFCIAAVCNTLRPSISIPNDKTR